MTLALPPQPPVPAIVQRTAERGWPHNPTTRELRALAHRVARLYIPRALGGEVYGCLSPAADIRGVTCDVQWFGSPDPMADRPPAFRVQLRPRRDGTFTVWRVRL